MSRSAFGGRGTAGRRSRSALLFIVTLCLLASAIQTHVSAASSEEIRTLALGFSEALDSANPYVGLFDISYVFYAMIYDTLITPDKGLKPQPNLASSWWYLDGLTAASLPLPTDFSGLESHADPVHWPLGSIWEYNLTRDVFWNDGTPFTADDVVWTINVQVGDNFAIYWAFQPYTGWIHHAEKVSDHKVRIFYSDLTTGEPFPVAFGHNINIHIMPKHLFAEKPSTYLAFGWEGFPAVGTGPFMGTPNLRNELIAKESITLVRNPFYDFEQGGVRKGLGGAYNRSIEIDRLVMKFFSEPGTMALAVRTGDVDAAAISPQTYLEWVRSPSALPSHVRLQSALPPTGFSRVVGFNSYPDAPGTLNPLRLDPALLRAAALATNKSYVKEQVYKGEAEIGYGITATPVWSDWYWSPEDDDSMDTFVVTDGGGNELLNYSKPMSETMDFDIELANQILTAAGYVWSGKPGESVRIASTLVAERLNALHGIDEAAVLGTGLSSPLQLSFEILYLQFATDEKQIAEYLREEWRNVGISLTPEPVNMATWSSNVWTYSYNFHITYWSGDIDPNYLCYIPTSFALWGWNDFGTMNDTYDEYYLNQARSFDYEERKRWSDECTRWQYLSGGSILTLAYPKSCFAYSEKRWSNWGNWTEHPNLAINSFWGPPPILCELKYTGDASDSASGMVAVAGGLIAAAAAAAILIILKRRRRESDERE